MYQLMRNMPLLGGTLALALAAALAGIYVSAAAHAQQDNDTPAHAIRLETCNRSHEEVVQHTEIKLRCDFQAHGRRAAVTILSEMRNNGQPDEPNWSASVWVLKNIEDSTHDLPAHDVDATAPQGSEVLYVDGQKTLRVEITGRAPRAYHRREEQGNYIQEYPRPTRFNILQVALGAGADKMRSEPVTAIAVDPAWRDARSLYEVYLKQADPDLPLTQAAAELGAKLLTQGDIAGTLQMLSVAKAAADKADSGNSGRIWWYVGGGIAGLLLVAGAAVIVYAVIQSNSIGGNRSGRRSRRNSGSSRNRRPSTPAPADGATP